MFILRFEQVQDHLNLWTVPLDSRDTVSEIPSRPANYLFQFGIDFTPAPYSSRFSNRSIDCGRVLESQ